MPKMTAIKCSNRVKHGQLKEGQIEIAENQVQTISTDWCVLS